MERNFDETTENYQDTELLTDSLCGKISQNPIGTSEVVTVNGQTIRSSRSGATDWHPELSIPQLSQEIISAIEASDPWFYRHILNGQLEYEFDHILKHPVLGRDVVKALMQISRAMGRMDERASQDHTQSVITETPK